MSSLSQRIFLSENDIQYYMGNTQFFKSIDT